MDICTAMTADPHIFFSLFVAVCVKQHEEELSQFQETSA
jgi:hypothetical protein